MCIMLGFPGLEIMGTKRNGIEIVLRFVDHLYVITESYINVGLLSFEDWCQNVKVNGFG